MSFCTPWSDAASALKQSVCEAAAKAFLNQRLEKLGSVTSLSLEPGKQTVCAELELKGESVPIRVEAGPYEIIRENGAGAIRFATFQTSREWITAALNEFVAGHAFPVPEVVVRVLGGL